MERVPTKTIVSGYTESSNWFGYNYSMNIYKGCCHGCIYCDSRSSCYQIIEFDRVRMKDNSTEVIKYDLQKKRKKGVIGMGAMSDPYNPFEKDLKLTREALNLIDNYRFGIGLATKSDLITRDIDILKKIKEHSPVIVKFTITTYDDILCKAIEPNVSVTSQRFSAMKQLSNNGIYVGALLMPILPFINDNENNIKNIVRNAYESGAKFVLAYGFGVTLRHNQREYYFEQLDKIFPNSNLVQKYKQTYGERYVNSSLKSKELWRVFKAECERYGLLYNMADIINDYKKGYETEQMRWF